MHQAARAVAHQLLDESALVRSRVTRNTFGGVEPGTENTSSSKSTSAPNVKQCALNRLMSVGRVVSSTAAYTRQHVRNAAALFIFQ